MQHPANTVFRTSLLVALLVAASPKTTVRGASHILQGADESERIIGGENARPGQFPWSVALYYDGQFVCTASIVSPNTVLTAAHCVIFDGQPQPAELFHGIANVRRSAPEVRIEFARVVAHPEYDDDDGLDHDIALLRTLAPVPVGRGGPEPVCLSRDDDAPRYRNATAMGWGNVVPFRFLPPYSPDNLQFAEQRIVPNSKCALLNPGIDERKICAKGPVGWSGICNGDSGGPLVHLGGDGPPVQIGVASYIGDLVGCGKFVPGVWTRTGSYVAFIAANDPQVCFI